MPDESLQVLIQRVAALRLEGERLLAEGKADEVKARLLTKKGELRKLQSSLGRLAPADRPEFGKVFNEAIAVLEAGVHAALESNASKKPTGPRFDFLPGIEPRLGNRHPLMRTIAEIADIFGGMGFTLAQGPEIEDVRHNFIALNIPEDHPARDARDNFFIRDDLLLRSQTSTIQVRVMENQPPPVRVFAIGRVYRPDPFDATHSPMFHQVEGLYVDRGVTMADLKTILRQFTRVYLGEDVRVRFRSSFFPFTEPSIEVDMSWGENNDQWIELGGAGMVDPNVFEAVGYDPEEVSGFAFGLGIERLAMRRYGVTHMRHLFENDVRFLQQFA